MNGKKILTAIILSLSLIFGVFLTCASAGFGSGVAVVASETKIIKTALSGKKIIFSDLDFKQGLAIADFDKIEIKSIPSSTEGTLLLAGRRVSVGTVIKRKNIGSLVFIPASKSLAECKFSFTTEDFAEGAEVDFIIKYTDKVNYAPELDESVSASVSTQRDISVYGQMSAHDKEGDEIEYIVVSYPKSGMLKISDKESGEYVYTPTGSFTGTDSFSYVARDEWGNYSKLCKVKIEVGERMSEVVYADMTDSKNYNAAVTLTAMGVMSGKLMGDGVYFLPGESVSRAEFITMAMKCVGISGDKSTSRSYFDDDAAIDPAYLPYVKVGAKLGIITGEFKDGKLLCRPTDTITKYEAASIIAKLIDVSGVDASLSFTDSDTVPVWARDELITLCSMGIISFEGDTLNAKDTLTRSDAAEYLYNMLRYC